MSNSVGQTRTMGHYVFLLTAHRRERWCVVLEYIDQNLAEYGAKNPEKSRQKFFDLAHNFFQNGAKIISFWRVFFSTVCAGRISYTSTCFLPVRILCRIGTVVGGFGWAGNNCYL